MSIRTSPSIKPVKRKKLLIVAHTPSLNTQRMVDAVLKGARHEDIENVDATHIPPLQATAADVLAADAIILGTTENLGYMSGALKDFFDRIYYPVLEVKQGLPVAAYIRAGHDGTGTKRALETILTGLKWRGVQAPLLCRGEFDEEFISQCEELGLTMAASLDAGVI
jgi:multimeric flavodoxin WrbA